MTFHHLSGDIEISFKIRFCVSQIIISTRILVKAASHRRYGKALTNIPIEIDIQSSTKKLISEYRNSDFQISGFAISSLKNIHELMRVFQKYYLKELKLLRESGKLQYSGTLQKFQNHYIFKERCD